MLKIKDNVDLKELRKFGYRYSGNVNRGEEWTKNIQDNIIRGIIIDGDWNNRKISFQFPYMDIKYPPIENFIKDLIQAGFVEKTEKK